MNKYYTQGFIKACQDHRVNPEQLVKAAGKGRLFKYLGSGIGKGLRAFGKTRVGGTIEKHPIASTGLAGGLAAGNYALSKMPLPKAPPQHVPPPLIDSFLEQMRREEQLRRDKELQGWEQRWQTYPDDGPDEGPIPGPDTRPFTDLEKMDRIMRDLNRMY